MTELLAKALLAYLLGGLIGGDVMRWLLGGADLRSAGSGNVGATNALRTRGVKFALAVLTIDIGKGVLAALAIPGLPWPLPNPATAGAVAWLPYVCGFSAALGHCYPLTQKFRGGKGVATLAGVFAVLIPVAALWAFAAFALVVVSSGYVSLASVSAGAVALFVVSCFRAGFWSIPGGFALAMFGLIVFKHRVNLRRLLAGTEPRFEKARLLKRRAAREPLP